LALSPLFPHSKYTPEKRPRESPRAAGQQGKETTRASFLEWLAESAAEFQPGEGRFGYAQLRHYTAAYCEMAQVRRWFWCRAWRGF
jgi:hypothetical protein